MYTFGWRHISSGIRKETREIVDARQWVTLGQGVARVVSIAGRYMQEDVGSNYGSVEIDGI